jgi:hypothetical protein
MENLDKKVFKPIDSLEPKKVMIFYRNNLSQDYVEVRDVDRKGKMLVGKPASIKTMNFIKDLVVESIDQIHVEVDCRPNKFFWVDTTPDNTLIAWTEKAQERIVRIGDINYKYQCPNTFWAYNGRDVYLYAYKRFRHFETTLYRLATPNIYDNGKICWGNLSNSSQNVFRKLSNFRSVVPQLFWNSQFNNHLQSGLPLEADLFYELNKQAQLDNHIESGKNIKQVLNALNQKFSI